MKENLTDDLSRLLDEMARKGITLSLEQSKILSRDYGIEIPPHSIAEYKYHERKKAFRRALSDVLDKHKRNAEQE